MIRRLSVALFLVLVLGACGGDTRVAVDAGDDSLTREQLITLTTALQNESAIDETSISAEDLRRVSSFYLVSAGYFDYLEDEGIEVPDDIRDARVDFISDQINEGLIGDVVFDGPEYLAYLDILMAGDVLDRFPLSEAELFEVLSEYTSDFEVESRLGTWDSTTATIIAP